MANLAQDQAVLTAMLGAFDDFVISDEVFWSLRDVRFPQLSIGGLALYARRVAALGAGDPDTAALLADYERKANEWRSNLRRKAPAEVRARLNSLRWFLEDCPDRPACRDYYPNEIAARVYLHGLLPLLGTSEDDDALRDQVAAVDGRLRRLLVSGAFVWEPDLQPAFPEQDFWYLYRLPRQP